LGKTAFITGGSRGIGKGIALALAGEGADIAFNYRRDIEAAKSTEGAIVALGRRALSIQADVTDYTQVKAATSGAWPTCPGCSRPLMRAGAANATSASKHARPGPPAANCGT